MGNTSDFFVDFIIAQNLEKVKFWEGSEAKPANEVSREGGERSREGRRGGSLAFPVSTICPEGYPSFYLSIYGNKKSCSQGNFFSKKA